MNDGVTQDVRERALSDGTEIPRAPLRVSEVPLCGVHLIEASAGTGKTFTITSLVLRLLVEEERPIETILAVTFTNAATAELKERVYSRILKALSCMRDGRDPGPDPVLLALCERPDRARAVRLLEKAAADVDRAGIFTIHGFAARMLSDHPFESGARTDADLVGDQRALVLDVVTDFWSKEVATLPEELFRQLGGTTLFRSLLRVGLTMAGALEVPVVEPTRHRDLSSETEALRQCFARAKAAFAEQGRELLLLLSDSAALNRGQMKSEALAKDFQSYVTYFLNDDPCGAHPGTKRFTATKVQQAVKKGYTAPQHPLLPLLEELKHHFQETSLAAAEYEDELRYRLCQHIERALSGEHQRERTQSFDGLLADLMRGLRAVESGTRLAQSIRKAFPVALIDEFQDTDPVQYEIFRRIYLSGDAKHDVALFLIGDPKQSIYAFRGADIFTYLAAARHARGGTWTLSTSYRASPSLVAAQNAWFENARQPFGLPTIAYQRVLCSPEAEDILISREGAALPGIVVQMSSENNASALHFMAQEVARFLAAGHRLGQRQVLPSDIAVLTRTNQQAQQLQGYLRELDIPAVMHGDRSVFESPEARELRRVLRALSEPGNRVWCRTALATRMVGFDATRLLTLEEDVAELEAWMGQVRKWATLFKTKGVAHALESLFGDVDLLSRTLRERDGERRMTNLRHLLELLHEAETLEHLGVSGLLRWFEATIADPSGYAMASEARQLRLESDADAVTLTTVHKSKGLEYEIVFLPTVGMPERKYNSDAFRFFDEGTGRSWLEIRGKATRDETAQQHQKEELQESLRLAYVALTRAKHHVVALLCPGKGFSPLSYTLLEANATLPGGLELTLEYLKHATEAQRTAAAQRVAERSHGTVQFVLCSDARGPRYMRADAVPVLVAPPALPQVLEQERTSSFSAMVRKSSSSRAAREGRDVDEVATSGVGFGESLEQKRREPRGVLADFPRGARPGDALHAMFEHCLPAQSDEEQARIAARELSKRGFFAAQISAATECLRDVLRTPLPAWEATAPIVLRELSPAARVPEMEFAFPVGLARPWAPIHRTAEKKQHFASAQPPRRLTPECLARALGATSRATERLGTSCPVTQIPDSYLTRVSQLEFSAFSGFLRGFIDLVYEHQGRIYALDYKSNHLGDYYDDYHPDALAAAMEGHHYVLQALLYCVAVHRYARSRIPDYQYQRHFGGMHYLFVRGLHPERRTGIYWMRPSLESVEALDRLFDDPAHDTAGLPCGVSS